MLASIAPSKLLAQSLFFSFALLAGWVSYRIGANNFLYFSRFFYGVLVFLLLLTIVIGRETRGSSRWLEIAGIRGQMSEFAKPILVLSGVSLLKRPRSMLFFIFAMIFPISLVFLEPDLGTAIVLFFIAATLLFFAGISRWALAAVLLMGVAMIPLSKYILADYQQRRVESFLNPYSDPRGAGYHAIQSTIAVGSGQLFGRGLGHGTQSRLRFLPERQTDFIFASLVEELGLVGGVLTLFLYGMMLAGLLMGALQARDRPDFLILVGCAGWLFFQSSITIAMNLGFAPVTGITLPFLSAGGSSLIASSILLALAVSALNFTHE